MGHLGDEVEGESYLDREEVGGSSGGTAAPCHPDEQAASRAARAEALTRRLAATGEALEERVQQLITQGEGGEGGGENPAKGAKNAATCKRRRVVEDSDDEAVDVQVEGSQGEAGGDEDDAWSPKRNPFARSFAAAKKTT